MAIVLAMAACRIGSESLELGLQARHLCVQSGHALFFRRKECLGLVDLRKPHTFSRTPLQKLGIQFITLCAQTSHIGIARIQLLLQFIVVCFGLCRCLMHKVRAELAQARILRF